MGEFDKLWGSRVPGFALGLGAKGYHALMAILTAELKQRRASFRYDEQVVHLTTADGRTLDLDLWPLVEQCGGRPRAEWERLVCEQLDRTLAAC